MRLSINAKLILTFLLVVALVILGTTLSFLGLLQVPVEGGDRPLRDIMRAQEIVRRQAAAAEALLAEGGEPGLERLPPPGLPAGQHWLIVTFEGRIVADSMGRAGQMLPVAEPLAWHLGLMGVEVEDGHLGVSHPVRAGGKPWGLYVALLPIHLGSAGGFGQIHTLVLVTGPVVGVLISLLLFWLFGRNLVRPVRQLSAVVGRIAGGDLDARTNLKPRGDELGLLARDIDRMAARLQESQAQAAAADDARRYWVAAASHDLRTPLTALLAHVEAIQTGVADDPEGSLAVIQAKGLLLKQLIDDLFELAALEGSAGRWQTVRTDLAELTRRAVVAALPELEAEGIEIEADIPGEPLPANLAPGKIERVLDNLIANARKYGGAGRYLGVRVERRGEAIRVTVVDRGPGIGPGEGGRIFERFYRSDGARTSGRGGAGLGLAIAREIVLRHGGAMGVESPPEGGASFWFEVPASM